MGCSGTKAGAEPSHAKDANEGRNLEDVRQYKVGSYVQVKLSTALLKGTEFDKGQRGSQHGSQHGNEDWFPATVSSVGRTSMTVQMSQTRSPWRVRIPSQDCPRHVRLAGNTREVDRGEATDFMFRRLSAHADRVVDVAAFDQSKVIEKRDQKKANAKDNAVVAEAEVVTDSDESDSLYCGEQDDTVFCDIWNGCHAFRGIIGLFSCEEDAAINRSLKNEFGFVRVQVPVGIDGVKQIPVKTNSGRSMQVRVPAYARPGQMMLVEYPLETKA